jgi:Fic family protein
VNREAVLSSKIEGTQASVSDVYLFEASGGRREGGDVREVANYIRALELGVASLEKLPLSVRMANEVHARLLQGVRGEDKMPGQLRTRQVWIGDRTTPIQESRFIPPPASFVRDLLYDWEQFVNADLEMPPLVQCALMHYQFEAIHPYLDGNGRIGRLLITLFLCAKDVLPTPLLYLSAYFERDGGDEYRDELLKVSCTGDWEGWIRYFLRGVAEQARDALVRSRRVRQLQERYRDRLQEQRASGNVFRLLDELFFNPFMTAPRARQRLGLTYAGARGVLNRLTNIGIVEYVSGAWPRLYVARELLTVIEAPVAAEDDDRVRPR